MALIGSELKKAALLAKRIPSAHKCNIAPYLSIRYIDEQIERLWRYLESNDLLENTAVVITADHGYWDYYDAKHPAGLVMSEERIHIPLMIYDGNLQDTKIHDEFLQNYQFPNLVLESLGLKSEPVFHDSRPLSLPLLCENLGFGCPDIFAIPIHYTVHSPKYKLVILAKLDREIRPEDCALFFDLTKDPLEVKNRINDQEYRGIIDAYRKVAFVRHEDVRNKTKDDYYVPPKFYEEEFVVE